MGITRNVPTWGISAIYHPLHYLTGMGLFVRDHYALCTTKHILQVTVALVVKEYRTIRTKSKNQYQHEVIRKTWPLRATNLVSPDKHKATLPFIGGAEKSRVTISKLSKFLKPCFEFQG